MRRNLWWTLAILAVLALCSISFGADGPQEYIYRPFWRTSPLSTASQMVNGTLGDRIRCFSVSLVDTTGYGTDMTYTADVRYNWQFALPDSGAICDCYEIAGSPDSLLWNNVWIPGKGRKESANQFSTDSRGRLKINRTVRADTLAASVIASKSAAGTVVSTDTLRVMMHARVASNLKVQGQTQLGNAAADTVKAIGNLRAQGTLYAQGGTTLGNAAADTVKMIGNVRVQNTFTTQGTTTLGNAAADAITSKGAFTAQDDLTAGNDSTDVTTITGRLDLDTTIYKEFTVTAGGGLNQAFTWTGVRPTWRFFAFWANNPGTLRTLAAYYSASNEITIEMVTGAIDGTVGVIAIRPSY